MAGKIQIEYDAKDVKELILADLRKKIPGAEFAEGHISSKVQSKQNYKDHEWETGKLQIMVDSSALIFGRQG